ncbi:NADPH-dependent F420 reductase [Actinokineospora bangkokensis]|uniref:NADP oxidoreductase n=1 Tax=Actinokineospora bangkokensis TaxID=1193682 RepID=A0A1Q9LPR7_9PSEU|nr:NAD(P)-binding domain-containing protein [Actinokineospora bangkokensis]OLR94020.1 NADP oxidoreductase [Actinokineospora bangkokensis]
MKIGIIGAGNIGGALTRGLTRLGHEVRIANSRGPETLADLAAETGATAVPATEAAEGAEVVVVTIPQKSIPDLPAGILDGAAPGAVVIDTGNYYPQQRDGRIDAIEAGTTESRWVADHLGAPNLVKAFNGIAALHLQDNGTPKGTADRIALPIAGDDPAAKQKVADLIDALGFDPVDAGTLDESWRQQPGTPGYGQDFPADRLKAALEEASPERTAEWKA